MLAELLVTNGIASTTFALYKFSNTKAMFVKFFVIW